MTPKEAAALWNPRRAPKSVRVVSYTTFSISCLWRPNIKSTSGDFWRTPGYSPRPTALFIIYKWLTYQTTCNHQLGRDPLNQNSDRSDREKRTTSKGGLVFSKLFRLDRTDPLSFGPKFPEILVEWIAPLGSLRTMLYFTALSLAMWTVTFFNLTYAG